MRVLRTVTSANSAATKKPLANTSARTAARRMAISFGAKTVSSITSLRAEIRTTAMVRGQGLGARG